ncbi:type II toxin-antitoxin system ParD family antitoxin [Sphingomonas yunnanensis]|uniref:type II toxin-antitoxin system ParD family antitoxin n=1 Tax=Sphingomonas yunnanensis TaxID=310400 RepID=UPI001CA70E03|nr:type II toxin-antitoxin system ParD family antitoxin [Sphingomonas yunnanensis]MBY9063352.1 type II toxin-antitoxin system ParD family antitoxin [Sphingomonas yunnanensis]
MPSPSSLNVSLTPELCEWISAQVASGRYRSASEVVRNALRALQEQQRDRAVDQTLVQARVGQ